VPYFVVWRTHSGGHRPGVPTRAIGGEPAGYATRRAAEAAAANGPGPLAPPIWDEWVIISAADAVGALRGGGTVATGWIRP
jgi:hypothetical protein